MFDFSSKNKAILLAGAFAILTYFLFRTIFQENQQIDFNTQIRPIINKKCITCHGGVKQSGGFSLLFPSDALMPNESGKPAIVPGEPGKSELISRIKHHDPEFRMPLEKESLSEEEIELLTEWIEQGAEWDDHWAFKKPEPIALPAISSDWISNGIDKFILRKLEDRQLQPSRRADKRTLLRRVSLDLIGLPPTRKELQNFLEDDSPKAYEKVVDRLLASPRFGERWASMWMDLARYADSKGYENDYHRSIWQYRDWLINAFNEDKPYDEFIIEQLAGDLLSDPTDDQLIATAFHRNTLNNDEGGTDNEEFRVAAVMDRVNTTWNALQATTMECVQCHSHPYDPIRHEDYYKSLAFFNNTADADTWVDDPKLVTFTNEEDQKSLEKIEKWISESTSSADEGSEIADFIKFVRLPEPKIHGHTFDQINKGGYINARYLAVEDGGYSLIKDITLHNETQLLIKYRSGGSNGKKVEIRIDSLSGELIGTWYVKEKKNNVITTIPIKPVSGKHDIFFKFSDPEQEDDYVCRIEWVLFYEGLPGENLAGYKQVREKFLDLLNSNEAITTPVMVELEQEYRRKTYVFERGNWMVHGKEVDPGVPEAWNEWPEDTPRNRLGMAEWFVSKDNPLTARVMVNRLWAQLFGTGIVETQEDFGSQGAAPSHPELLDWLAQQFMNEHNWSIKKQLKQLVMSATYQQFSGTNPELQKQDPQNRLLASGPRIRLTAEQIRDQALAVSGLLSDKMYGESVMPPQPEGVWRGDGWKTSEGEDKHRRAIYTYVRRTSPYPSMITFDSPSREFCVVRRINTNTPLQALVTLNDPVFIEAAQALAVRMKNSDIVEEQIKSGYRLAMVKEIDADKLKDLQLLYQQAMQRFKDNAEAAERMTGTKDIELAALTVVGNAIMNLDEFLTKS
jgi:uncharacterized protein YoaH (UPF0181 family)